MSSIPDIEFVLWTVHASPEDTREMLYTLPDNVPAHHHVYLDPRRASRGGRANAAARQQAVDAMRAVVHQEPEGWERLMDSLRAIRGSAGDLTQSAAFLEMAREVSDQTPGLALADAFYGLRSMFQPI